MDTFFRHQQLQMHFTWKEGFVFFFLFFSLFLFFYRTIALVKKDQDDLNVIYKYKYMEIYRTGVGVLTSSVELEVTERNNRVPMTLLMV